MMPVSSYVGRTDDGHQYARAYAWCRGCQCEGEPVVGTPSDLPRLRAEAALAADIDATGLCTRCRAAGGGV